MVNHAVFLLVCLIMFFIDHNQPQFRKRQEQCRARAHYDPGLAGHHLPVCSPARGFADARMPLHRPASKTRGKAVQELHRERDFRQQNQRLPSFRQCLRNGFEIGFGFPAARDAIK